MKHKILFCNIAYMQFYDNNILDKPVNGGSYVQKENDAYEKYNFQECEDGYYRGFVETKHREGYKQGIKNNTYNQIHIENIDPNSKRKDSIDNVLVVLCAKPINGKTVIVGWYKNATVYRQRPYYNERFFNLQAKIEDSVLLPEEERKFEIPRSNVDGFGFGQSNIWYANSTQYDNFINSVIDYINNYVTTANNYLPEEVNDYAESGVGKKITVNAFERNAKARNECLRVHGAKCHICGFDAEKIYGTDFKNKIHVHHIIPIHSIGKEYKVNPSTDLIPVCPNCHMILHTKVNGVEPTVEQLKQIIKK